MPQDLGNIVSNGSFWRESLFRIFSGGVPGLSQALKNVHIVIFSSEYKLGNFIWRQMGVFDVFGVPHKNVTLDYEFPPLPHSSDPILGFKIGSSTAKASRGGEMHRRSLSS